MVRGLEPSGPRRRARTTTVLAIPYAGLRATVTTRRMRLDHERLLTGTAGQEAPAPKSPRHGLRLVDLTARKAEDVASYNRYERVAPHYWDRVGLGKKIRAAAGCV